MKSGICFFLLFLAFSLSAQEYSLSSPDKKIKATIGLTAGKAWYKVARENTEVLQVSKLGIIREDADFSTGLKVVSVTPAKAVSDSYQMLSSKRKLNVYKANNRVFHLKNASGQAMDIIFQVSNDGLVFRYYFPGTSTDVKKIKEEFTTYKFAPNTKAWLQPMANAKSGWAEANPSYEEFWHQAIPVGTPSPIKAGWIYPALFQAGTNWVLISETFPEGNYCGTRLKAESPDGEYAIGFPQPGEVFSPQAALNPESKLPWYTPWRVIALGSLKTVVESALGTDVSKPAVKMDLSFIKPGISSWSWVLLKDRATVYNVQKRFVDYAADMGWEYCLVDAEWDKQIGYDKMKELADYAKTKNVGVLVWYNSAGAWNTTPQTPKNKLLTAEDRKMEFARISSMGIKGIKVDFFGGDGQSFMQYYHDILRDAAAAKLLVNFHGTTLPRGLQRTYPNLVTMESIKGMEFRTFEQGVEDTAATHAAMAPFTRNVFDAMDYTPTVLHQIPKIKRQTSNGFELALSVLFQSGVQHIAETDQGVKQVPDYVKSFLKSLPVGWDDIKFIEGYPGKLAVIARKAGNKWYVAGINGENTEKKLSLDLSAFKAYKAGKLITDGAGEFSFSTASIVPQAATQIMVKSKGGFVMVFGE
ncbi:MAG: glycoside hydrolase family 97 catalytic domain-containing protein [Sphingobacteriaceae bacterium]|nr:glycoside hydrolase family 97 catalytic domain-containing protein [Sphingobacteriaceae bacterium]